MFRAVEPCLAGVNPFPVVAIFRLVEVLLLRAELIGSVAQVELRHQGGAVVDVGGNHTVLADNKHPVIAVGSTHFMISRDEVRTCSFDSAITPGHPDWRYCLLRLLIVHGDE